MLKKAIYPCTVQGHHNNNVRIGIKWTFIYNHTIELYTWLAPLAFGHIPVAISST